MVHYADVRLVLKDKEYVTVFMQKKCNLFRVIFILIMLTSCITTGNLIMFLKIKSAFFFTSTFVEKSYHFSILESLYHLPQIS